MYGQSKKLLGCWILGYSLLVYAISYGQAPTPTVPSNKPKSQSTSEQKKAATDQRGTEHSPLVIKILESEHANQKAANVPEERDHKAAFNWWGIPTDGWLVIFTCGLFVATLLLWLATRKLVKGAQDTAERQLRAYLLPIFGNVRDFGSHVTTKTQVILQNTGQTPAYDVRTRFWISAEGFPLRGDLPRPHLGDTPSRGLVGREGKMNLDTETSRPLTVEEVTEIRRGAQAVFIYGDIDYLDAFGKPRYTRFIYFYGGDYGTDEAGSIGHFKTEAN